MTPEERAKLALQILNGHVGTPREEILAGYFREAILEEREACAKVADGIAERRVATEAIRGFGPETATPAANSYWCEGIASAIRSRSKEESGE